MARERVDMKKWCVLFILFVSTFGSLGCAEYAEDDAWGICPCSTQAQTLSIDNRDWSDAYAMNIDDTSDLCALLNGALEGDWEADLPVGPLRYTFYKNGQYQSYRKKNGKWSADASGTYHIEYHRHQGLYRSELHMTLPDTGTVYPVRFYMNGDELCFEEHMGDLELLKFQKVTTPED